MLELFEKYFLLAAHFQIYTSVFLWTHYLAIWVWWYGGMSASTACKIPLENIRNTKYIHERCALLAKTFADKLLFNTEHINYCSSNYGLIVSIKNVFHLLEQNVAAVTKAAHHQQP